MKFPTLCLAGLALFLSAPEAWAAGPTSVRDSIIVSTTWTRDNGPYVIQNDIQVAKGAVLTIEPGTQVQFTVPPGGKIGMGPNLIIQGGLRAVGDEKNPISFGPSVTGALWGAIYFYGSDPANSVLQWCLVKGGRIVCNNASPTVSQSSIYGAKSGVEIAANSQPQITGNRITADGVGVILLSDTSSPVLSNNDIYNNNYGFYLKDFGAPSISGNRIYSNLKYNVVNNSSKAVTLPNNDFRLLDAAAISKTLYDTGYNPKLGKVEFTPFVTTAPLLPPQAGGGPQEKPQILESDLWSYGRPFDALKISKMEDKKANSSDIVKIAAVGATAIVTVILLFF